ncbi:MAG: prolipoprotein diacylglyceryl transferase [Chitinophagales bacterium]|nr:prolipoprotein diacylglyceryl transferase [Chitinophagales bacterium]MDW8273068.1 prolipoprotein diacylglyceryl transferase [Chitinophagales bacterium]
MLLRCYPRITDWLYEVSGIDLRFLPIYSYGFFVALGFVAAAIVAAWEMRRRERLGLLNYTLKTIKVGEPPKPLELLINALLGFIVFFKIAAIFLNKDVFSANPQGFLFSMEGNWPAGIVGGLLFGAYYYYKAKKQQLPEPKTETIKVYPSQQIGDLLVLAAVLGVLGANFFNYLENPEDYEAFIEDPIGSLFSGLSVLGGLITAGIGFAIFAYVRKIHLLHFFDCVAPGYILANGIGRLGCQVSGDGDWGIVNVLPKPFFIPKFLWADTYPHNIIRAGVPIPGCEGVYCTQLPLPVFPTPIYEFIQCSLICLLLLAIRKKVTHIPGMIFSLFLILNGIQRFSIEKIRDVSDRLPYFIFGLQLRQAELISIIMVISGITLTIIFWRVYHKKLHA